MTTDTPPLLSLGAVITPESEWPDGTPESPAYQVAALDNDGSRRCVGTGTAFPGPVSAPTWPANRSLLLGRFPDNPLILWGPILGPAISTGRYAPYITSDSPADPGSVTEPVNPIPWVLHWKQHLAEIAHEWVHTPGEHLFHHETNTTGFSPATAALTTAQEAKFETSSKVVRRALGVLFGKALVVDLIDPIAVGNWRDVVRTIDALVVQFCADCSGRGFKRRMLRYINEAAWAARYAAVEGGVYFFDRTTSPTSWGVGPPVTTDIHEAGAAIANFQRALVYYEETTGDEDDHTLPAL